MARGRKKMAPREEMRYMAALAYLRFEKSQTLTTAAQRLGIGRDKARELLREAQKRRYLQPATFRQLLSSEDDLVLDLMDRYGENVNQFIVMPSWPPSSKLRKKKQKALQVGEHPAYEDFLKRSLGRVAANYIEDNIELNDGDHIAVGSGRTMLAFAENFSAPDKHLVFRPLDTGGRWRSITHYDASFVLQTILSRHPSRSVQEPPKVQVICPEAPPRYIGDVRSSPEVAAIFGKYAPEPAAAICSIGHVHFNKRPFQVSPYVQMLAERKLFDSLDEHEKTAQVIAMVAHFVEPADEHHPKEESGEAPTYGQWVIAKARKIAALVQSDNPPPPEEIRTAAYYSMLFRRLEADDCDDIWNSLRQAKITGELCRYGIMADGTVVEGFLDKTLLATNPNTLRKWRGDGTETILVAAGRQVAKATAGALRAGYFSVAIMDMGLAEALLEQPENSK